MKEFAGTILVNYGRYDGLVEIAKVAGVDISDPSEWVEGILLLCRRVMSEDEAKYAAVANKALAIVTQIHRERGATLPSVQIVEHDGVYATVVGNWSFRDRGDGYFDMWHVPSDTLLGIILSSNDDAFLMCQLLMDRCEGRDSDEDFARIQADVHSLIGELACSQGVR